MSCIKNDIIQKYIDGEATPKEVAFIEKHMADCEKCAAKVDHQQRVAAGLKKAINLLAQDTKEIPTIVLSPSHIKKHFLAKKRLIYCFSAACLLLLVFIVSHKKIPENMDHITIIHTLGPDIDANRPITEQQMVINVIDSKGNVTEYNIK